MLIWIVLALMTGVAVLAVLVPLSRSRGGVSAGDHDTAVYRDQLREIERDLERGVIAPAEAEAARIEVGRRLLAAADRETGAQPSRADGTRRRFAAIGALILVPAVALGVYLMTGSPNVPAQPLAARLEGTPDRQDIDVLLARIERRLQESPDDGHGWDIVSRVYMQQGRPREAAMAFANAIRLLGSDAERQAGLGEALLMIAGGVVTAQAKQAFEAALRHDPGLPSARYYIARAFAQQGDSQEAIRRFSALLADAPPGAPWVEIVRRDLAELGAPAPTARAAAPGPTRDDLSAAAAMPPQERATMIRSMVERLAERLRDNADDPEGWIRLVRAYAVLGDTERAREALRQAKLALTNRPGADFALDRLARELGLGT
jgi:cytochrome c-type biogenesis protein CcmH